MDKYIQDYLDYLKLKGKSPLTIRNYSGYLKQFSEFCENISPEKISINHIDSFHQKLQSRGISLRTQSYYLISIRTFLKYLKVRKDINVLDSHKIELPKIRRPIHNALSTEEVEKLLSVATFDNAYDTRARAILEILICSGIRVNELVNIKINKVDLKDKWFRVVGKGNKERVCFLNDSSIEAIKKYLENRTIVSPYLITHHLDKNSSDPITTRQIERLVKEFGKRAGIGEVHPHKLRRTFAVTLLRKNVDIRFIQEFLGHESIMTTQFYTKVERTDLEKVFRHASKNSVKELEEESEQISISKDSLLKLIEMLDNSRRLQNKILRKLEKGEKKVILAKKTILVN